MGLHGKFLNYQFYRGNTETITRHTMKSTKRSLDFRALELKLNEESEYPHTVYYKEHSVRDHSKDKPSGRTLFVVNVPPYADEKGLENAFQEAGTVQSVQLCLKPNTVELGTERFVPDVVKPSFRVAYIIFSKVLELDKALKLTELQPMNSDKYKIPTGMSKWMDQYNSSILTQTSFKEKVENFMKKHDEEIKKAEDKEKELQQEDEDGWVTVTKRGKVQSFARSEKVENKIMQKEEKNKKRKELKNFYTFQIRESKMKHIVTLRQKFEEDKRKIAQIKQSRRFKPF